ADSGAAGRAPLATVVGGNDHAAATRQDGHATAAAAAAATGMLHPSVIGKGRAAPAGRVQPQEHRDSIGVAVVIRESKELDLLVDAAPDADGRGLQIV